MKRIGSSPFEVLAVVSLSMQGRRPFLDAHILVRIISGSTDPHNGVLDKRCYTSHPLLNDDESVQISHWFRANGGGHGTMRAIMVLS